MCRPKPSDSPTRIAPATTQIRTSASIPVEWLSSKAYAAERAKLIRPDRILPRVHAGAPPARGDTTYLTVADSSGMMVSMIQSNYRGLGSGLVADGLGFMFQRPGQLFSLDDGPSEPVSTRQAARSRPSFPALPRASGRPWMSFGVMGADMQPQGQTQIIVNRVDYGLDIQAAGDSPRWHHVGSPQRMGEDEPRARRVGGLHLETGVPAGDAARARANWAGRSAPSDGAFGRYQCIEQRLAAVSGLYAAASEMRADGVALAY